MRKKLVCIVVLIGCLLGLCACDVATMSSLAEVSKPYVGEYRCEKLLLGGEDMLDKFEYIKLNLKYGGEFALRYLGVNGDEGGFAGTYEMAPSGESITFSAKAGVRTVSHTFDYRKGTILIAYAFGEKLLYGEFCFP